MQPAPIVMEHAAVLVVRDDLFPGGTKAHFLGQFFNAAEEMVYASPSKGGAQVALATVARQLRKLATIFVAREQNRTPARCKRQSWGPR
jgi:hypothetical protein